MNSKLFVRIIAIVLAVLFVVTILVQAVPYLFG